jgi:hypothetical protein
MRACFPRTRVLIIPTRRLQFVNCRGRQMPNQPPCTYDNINKYVCSSCGEHYRAPNGIERTFYKNVQPMRLMTFYFFKDHLFTKLNWKPYRCGLCKGPSTYADLDSLLRHVSKCNAYLCKLREPKL